MNERTHPARQNAPPQFVPSEHTQTGQTSNNGVSTLDHKLPPLPYELDALSPHLSKETLEFHYGKHHRAYVAKLNELQRGTDFEGLSLVEVVKRASGSIYDNAAQHWNHSFFWKCMQPAGGGQPKGSIGVQIDRKFGNYSSFKEAFTSSAVGNFGSGWTWLVRKASGAVDIVNMGAAGTPLTTGDKPLLTIDVWEHAYYIDHRNERQKWVKTFLASLVNWEFAGAQYQE